MPSARFAALLHSWPRPKDLAEQMKKKRLGVGYATDAGKDGNPWSRLPSWWDK